MSRQTKNNLLTNKAEIPKGKPVEKNVTSNNPSSTDLLISLSLACVADVWKEMEGDWGTREARKAHKWEGEEPPPFSLVQIPFHLPFERLPRRLDFYFFASKLAKASLQVCQNT